MGGISGDIVQRKLPHEKHHAEVSDFVVHKPEKTPEIEKDEAEFSPDADFYPYEDSEASDGKPTDQDQFGFFDEHNIIQSENKHKQSFAEKFFGVIFNIWFLWLVFFILFGVLVVQNFSYFKSLIIKEKTVQVVSDSQSENLNNQTTNITVGSTSSEAVGSSVSTSSDKVGTQTETETAAPAPSTSIDKNLVKIEVLNGNGITGSANQVASDLKKAGFTISKTANAKKFTYATTIIYYKSGQAPAAKLAADAISNRSISQIEDNTVTSGYDLVVVVGKK